MQTGMNTFSSKLPCDAAMFFDIRMRDWPRYAFHPNDNRATVLIEHDEFMRYLAAVGNTYEFIELY